MRRLDRAGEGEYRLAGARCRLVDVIELLSDTGLGKEMHSVISQGRVESIVTSKPRDRRLLIEEAAGLGKHRKRRRRAQLKLDRTQDNLDRALDVEREARSRLRPLKRQAEAAELHARLERQTLEIRWELARDGVPARPRRAEADAAAAEVAPGAQALERELADGGRRREAAEEALAARSAQREELSRRAYAARSAGERVGYRAESTRAAAAASSAAWPAPPSGWSPCGPRPRPMRPTPRRRGGSRRWRRSSPRSSATARRSWPASSSSSSGQREAARPTTSPSRSRGRARTPSAMRVKPGRGGAQRRPRSRAGGRGGPPGGGPRGRRTRRRSISFCAARPASPGVPPRWPTSSTSTPATSWPSLPRWTAGCGPRSSTTARRAPHCSTAPGRTAGGRWCSAPAVGMRRRRRPAAGRAASR